MIKDLVIAVIGLFILAGVYAAWHQMHGPVACTTEAKLCPDGSAVGRTGPHCEFAPCPDSTRAYVGTGFSVRYPAGWSAQPTDGGVTLVVDPAMVMGTNLGSDSSVSIEHLPAGVACTDATSTDAGAGNRYEEWIYALSNTSPCLAVRYFIHYGVIENYPEGAVREFDRGALLKSFDDIRRTVVLAPAAS